MSKHILSGDGICQEYTVQIYVYHLIPLLKCHLLCRSVDADPCVCVAEVQSSELLNHLVHHRLNIALYGAVALDRDNLASGRLCDLLRSLLGFLDIEIYYRHIGSRLGKAGCGTLSDASRTAGHETFPAVQPHALNNPHIHISFHFSLFILAFHFVKPLYVFKHTIDFVSVNQHKYLNKSRKYCALCIKISILSAFLGFIIDKQELLSYYI